VTADRKSLGHDSLLMTRLFLLAVVALLACQSGIVQVHAADAGSAAFKQVGDELAVGKNRTGEACRVRLVESLTSTTPIQRFSLFCDGWNQPSGQISRAAASKDHPPQRLVSEGAWYRSLSGRLGDCRPVEATTLADGTVAALRECTRAQGGWRVLILATVIDKECYALEALPTNLPVLEVAVQVLAGKRPGEAPADASMVSAAIAAQRPWWVRRGHW
jgi:hypothetical protein